MDEAHQLDTPLSLKQLTNIQVKLRAVAAYLLSCDCGFTFA